MLARRKHRQLIRLDTGEVRAGIKQDRAHAFGRFKRDKGAACAQLTILSRARTIFDRIFDGNGAMFMDRRRIARAGVGPRVVASRKLCVMRAQIGVICHPNRPSL